MKNQVHIKKDFGWFIGSFDNNQFHKHYGIQLSIPVSGSVSIRFGKQTLQTEKPVLIKPNVPHQIISDSSHFLLLINPASTIGHYWNKNIANEVAEFLHSPAIELQKLLTGLESISDPGLKINDLITSYDCFCNASFHEGDERIDHALQFLKEHADRIVGLDEIASNSNLSESRFLHLFKEETGITYRRAQLWNRITFALQLIGKKSLTEVAHEAGFADSAHFSRTFKENFGFSPRAFLKISQFIQV